MLSAYKNQKGWWVGSYLFSKIPSKAENGGSIAFLLLRNFRGGRNDRGERKDCGRLAAFNQTGVLSKTST